MKIDHGGRKTKNDDKGFDAVSEILYGKCLPASRRRKGEVILQYGIIAWEYTRSQRFPNVRVSSFQLLLQHGSISQTLQSSIKNSTLVYTVSMNTLLDWAGGMGRMMEGSWIMNYEALNKSVLLGWKCNGPIELWRTTKYFKSLWLFFLLFFFEQVNTPIFILQSYKRDSMCLFMSFQTTVVIVSYSI